jgi:hypothetical protein
MFRLVVSIMLIVASIVGFSMFTLPLYNEISTLKTKAASFDEALGNSKALENERDKLTGKYNSILPENLLKLDKLLPDNVDNIRLILEIEKIALPYGMVLKDVRYDTISKKDTPIAPTGAKSLNSDVSVNQNISKDYGVWNLEFSTQGTYTNFLNFVKKLDSNLRIVDISSVSFSSDVGSGLNPSFVESYKYGFKIKTYWLKN